MAVAAPAALLKVGCELTSNALFESRKFYFVENLVFVNYFEHLKFFILMMCLCTICCICVCTTISRKDTMEMQAKIYLNVMNATSVHTCMSCILCNVDVIFFIKNFIF